MTHWKNSVFMSLWLGALAMSATSHAQDASSGMTLFKQRCAICHATDQSKKSPLGPNLAGVMSRMAGARPDFSYSTALKNSKIRWSSSAINQFLSSPTKMIPGSRMPVAVPSAQDRAAIVAYLATLR